MDLGKLCAAAAADLAPLGPVSGTEVGALCHRTDDVRPGALFACVRGARVDGHELARDAVERGATALLVDHELPLRVPQLLAADTRRAMGPLADAFYGRPSERLRVVGVTGTNGKTTTAFLVAAIFEAAGQRCGLLGTVRQRIGGRAVEVPLTTPEAFDLQRSFCEMLDAGDAACSMEASSIAIARRRLEGTRFAAVGFTNLSQDHLDFHGSMEAYFACKAELFDGRFPRAVNADDAWCRGLDAELRFGLGGDADVRCDELALGVDGTTMRVRTPSGTLELATRLRGRFNVDNVLCAVALALLVGLDASAIRAGVAACAAPPGRFEPVEVGQPFAVIVDYAHTPAGIEAVLASARSLGRGRVLCVVGAGGDRDRAKRPLMGAAAEAGADRVYLTSDNPRSEPPESILAEVRSGLRRPERAVVEVDRREAIRRALADAGAGDVVVIAGKGHEQGQEVGGSVRPFDDRDVARELLEAS